MNPIVFDTLIQYLLEGDLVGFIIACYTSVIGDGFYAIIALAIFGVAYNRTKSIAFCSILWLLIASALIVTFQIVSPLAIIMAAFAIGGILYSTFGSKHST